MSVPHLALPRVGLGTAPLGGLYEPVNDVDAAATLRAAYARGIRYFDTAPLYGHGTAETLLGKVANSWDRNSVQVSTKVGRLLRADGEDDPYYVSDSTLRPVRDYSARGVKQSITESLARLQLDYVDIAFVHDPDLQSAQVIEESLPALEQCKDEGQVRMIGIGMNQWQVPMQVMRRTRLDVVLVAGRYTLLDQSAAPLLRMCQEAGTTLVLAGVYNSGILARADTQPMYDYAPASGELVARARTLKAVCEQHGVALATAAVQFPLRHPAVDCVLVGVRSLDELNALTTAVNTEVPDELWCTIADRGFLPHELVEIMMGRSRAR